MLGYGWREAIVERNDFFLPTHRNHLIQWFLFEEIEAQQGRDTVEPAWVRSLAFWPLAWPRALSPAS